MADNNGKTSLNGKYRVRVPDLDYLRGNIGCQRGCPVKTDARGYVIATAEGRYLEGYKIARAPNPFASMCGRICGAPCEATCTRGKVDEPVAIRAIKRWVTEQYGVESIPDLRKTLEWSNARGSAHPVLDKAKVAIIGAGVAGLTAAHDLARLGYRCTVFEREPIPGGQLAWGVPIYRYDRELMNLEISAILSLGIELRLNCEIGRDITIPQLREQGYKAVFLASGLYSGRDLKIVGRDLKNVYLGMEFLRQMNYGKPVDVGKRVVVLGGGNVAMDVARTAVRAVAGTLTGRGKEWTVTDVARSALRLGVEECHVVCGDSREEQTADEYEVDEALDEGVVFHNRWLPKRLIGENGRVAGVELQKVIRFFDETGRINPILHENVTEIIPCDSFIITIGQASDLSVLTGVENEVKSLPNGLVQIDPETLQTTAPDIWAGGDIGLGARLFIDAIASGQKAAISIDEALSGKKVKKVERGFMKQLPLKDYSMPAWFDRLKRKTPAEIPADFRRDNFKLVEMNYNEDQARVQGMRCLHCHTSTIFDGEECIMCALCINICPESILKMVPICDLTGDEKVHRAVLNRFGIPLEEIYKMPREEAAQIGTAMLIDNVHCIRCGLCAKTCPVGCITMEELEVQEEYVYAE